jgi:hypothetical protein
VAVDISTLIVQIPIAVNAFAFTEGAGRYFFHSEGEKQMAKKRKAKSSKKKAKKK